MATLRDAEIKAFEIQSLFASQGRRSGHTAALARDPPSEHRVQVVQNFLRIGGGTTVMRQVFFLYARK